MSCKLIDYPSTKIKKTISTSKYDPERKKTDITLVKKDELTRYRHLQFIIPETNEIIKINETPMTRSKLLMYSLSKFYTKSNTLSAIIPIIKKKSPISLRLLEWVVMKKAKPYNNYKGLVFPIQSKKSKKIKGYIHVYKDYQKTLKTFSGEYFGIFKRSDIVTLKYGKNPEDQVATTVAQLNFFRWTLEIKLVDYIKTHFIELASELYKSKRKYDSNLLTKITQEENEKNIEITIEWDQNNNSN